MLALLCSVQASFQANVFHLCSVIVPFLCFLVCYHSNHSNHSNHCSHSHHSKHSDHSDASETVPPSVSFHLWPTFAAAAAFVGSDTVSDAAPLVTVAPQLWGHVTQIPIIPLSWVSHWDSQTPFEVSSPQTDAGVLEFSPINRRAAVD